MVFFVRFILTSGMWKTCFHLTSKINFENVLVFKNKILHALTERHKDLKEFFINSKFRCNMKTYEEINQYNTHKNIYDSPVRQSSIWVQTT